MSLNSNNNNNWLQTLVSNIDPTELYIETNDNDEVSFINKTDYNLSQQIISNESGDSFMVLFRKPTKSNFLSVG